jgi:hypothetical protein
MLAAGNQAVVGGRCVWIERTELTVGVGVAVCGADGVGVVFESDGCSQAEVWLNLPRVLSIGGKIVDSDRLSIAGGVLLIVVVKTKTAVEGAAKRLVGKDKRRRCDRGAVVGDIIATEVDASLDIMATLGDAEVVDKLIVGDVTTLRPGVVDSTKTGKAATTDLIEEN